MISQERLRELFHYDPETGIFTRIKRAGHELVGSVIRTHDSEGYVRGAIDRKSYKAHRLAWLYVYGRWPIDQIDHINGKRDDNRLCNLREATQAQNSHNSKPYQSTQSKLKGVARITGSLNWQARIRVNGRMIYLGAFETEEDAHAAYCAAAIEHFGEFARTE